MKTHLLLLILLFGIISFSEAQVSINQSGNDPHESAMLDVSSTDKGLLIPRLTSYQRLQIANPVNGLLVFDLTNNSFWFYNEEANQWEQLSGSEIELLNDLTDAQSDQSSVFLGYQSGINDNGGNSNVAIGINSLRNNVNGYYNSAVGFGALQSNISGKGNAANGMWALNKNNGNYNTAVGNMAMYFNNSGSENVAIGNGAMKWNNGHKNTIIGQNAGGSLGSGDANIFLGYKAGFNESGSNKLYIENSPSSTPLIGGDFATDEVDINGDLNVNGQIRITGGNPAEGKVLTSDENGNASWMNSSGGAHEINDLLDAKKYASSMYFGDGAGNTNNGGYNIALGDSAMSGQNSSGFNIAIGYKSGYSSTSASTYGNIFLGHFTGIENTEDNQLIIENGPAGSPLILGDFAEDHLKINGTLEITGGNPADGKVLVSDATGKASWEYVAGAQNINQLNDAKTNGKSLYMGEEAGDNDTQDTESTGIGYQSLLNNTGLYNNAIGYASLFSNTDGFDNTAFGRIAMSNNTIGNRNVGFGNSTLNGNKSGSDNTAIGAYAGANTPDNISGSIFIGSSAGYNATENNKLYIENSSSETPLIGGDFATDEVVINGTLQITGGDPGAGKVLVSDANGKASWSHSSGATSINDLSDAKNDNSSIFLGTAAATDDGNNKNTATGIQSLSSNNSGQYNAAFGHKSLNANSEGSSNSSFGYGSMELNTTGNENTALGSGALYNNGGGSQNTAIGFEAGFGSYGSNSTGNVFLGYKAGYNETGSNKLYISNTDTEFPLVYGDFAQNKFEVNGEFKVVNESYNNFKINNDKMESNVPIDANSTLEVAQTLTVDGEITANDQINAHEDIVLSDNKNIKYENARTAKINYGGSEFHWSTYEENYYSYGSYHEGTTLAITTQPYSGRIYFHLSKQIQLPEGAKIKNIKLHFGGGSEDEVDIKIVKRSFEQTYHEGEELFESTLHFVETDMTTYEFGFPVDPIIDNEFIYQICLNAQVNDNDNGFGGIFVLNTVSVEYEYDTLNY